VVIGGDTGVFGSSEMGEAPLLQGGEAGRLVPPGEPALLAAALYDVLQDTEERRRLAAAGLAAAQRLSWTRVTDEIIAAYEDAVAVGDRPGVHGLPGRPWFGRAALDYKFTGGRAGRS
jgi:glycosyltransferase involved in cell wall biosynthesis